MASSVSDDQDQRNNAGLEDLTTMTIESLRARLLSERSISKSSRQRADELAKRVLELEEQLKMVSLQRKKAEKATADVLAILESNGISDASDAYDSNCDQETISDSKVSDDTMKRKETSSNFEVRKSDMEAYSSSEIDSSPSTGRSLSWKSSKDSLHSLQRTKCMEAVRRRSSTFPSNGSSFSKRVGKSCRRIRRRESRSVAEQLQDNTNMHESQGNTVDTFSKDSPSRADIEHSANQVENNAPETPVTGMPGNRGVNAFYSDGNGQNEDIDGTLQHQTQLIGQFEAKEKDQMEWEERVRENNSSVLDSCDPGNRSDVTEERDDVKASGNLNPGGTINTHNLGSKLELVKPSFELELKVANGMVNPSNVDDAYLQDQRSSSMVDPGSPSLELTYASKVNQSQVISGNVDKTPPRSSHVSSISPGKAWIPSVHDPSVSAKDGESSGTKKELALIPQNSSNNLESVLKALQQARLSLNEKLQGIPLSENGSSVTGHSVSVMRTGEQMEIPVGCPGIFRLPTDFLCEATAKASYLGSNSASILAHRYNEPSTERFLGSPYEERRSSALLGNQLYASAATPSTGIWSEVHRPTQTPAFPQGVSGLHASAMPFMETESGTSASRAVYENASDTGLLPSATSSYFDPQFYPGLVPRLHASTMAFTEIQPSIQATRPAYESASSSGPSSGGSSYLDHQLNQGLVLPGTYTYPTYPFYPEVVQQLPANDRLASNVPSMEYSMPPASGFSFDDHFRIRPNMYK